MKTLVGVDLQETYRSALQLASRLRFPKQEWIFTSTVPPIATYAPGFSPVTIPVGDAIATMHEAGRKAVAEAARVVAATDENAIQLVVDGDPSATLMRIADQEKVDLIATGCGAANRHFPWTIGSVSRSLGFGAHQSLLVTKGPADGDGPLRAVFATDHSAYAKCALDHFVEWAPQGIRRVDVLTAYEVDAVAASMLAQGSEVDLEFAQWIVDHTKKESEAAATKLKTIIPEVNVLIEQGQTNKVISDAMSTSGADLLILGAQGHGFLERLLVGSTSLHQLVVESYPVLLIRLPR